MSKVISIRQPWASLIINGPKYVENRTWATKYRGPILIHAGLKIEKVDFWDKFIKLGWPQIKELPRGGIIGKANLTDCVHIDESESSDEWFEGPYGFILEDREEVEFMPLKGQLGIFNV